MSAVLLVDASSIVHQVWHTSGNEPNPDYTALKTVERVRDLPVHCDALLGES